MTIHRGRKNRFIYLILPFILVTPFAVFQSANAADTQKKVVVQTSVIKKAGRVTDSTNTILSGKGAPAASLGLVGDLYIDVASMNFYGPKLATKWPTPVSLKGPAGPMGPSGVDGKTGSTLSGVKGETGATGATGAAGVKGASGDSGSGGGSGPTGPTGPAGAAGVAGVAGVAGPAGAAGVAGAAGSNGTKGDTGLTGSTGSQGNQGIQGNQGNPGGIGSKGDTGTKGDTGLTGDVGLTGNQGIKGDPGTQGNVGNTGNQGAAGISNASFGLITFASLNGAADSEITSASFGNFLAGKIYVIDIQIRGVLALLNESSISLVRFNIPGFASPTTFSYLVSSGNSYRSGGAGIENDINVKLLLDGSSITSDFKLQAVVGVHPSTTPNTFNATGAFLAEQVGSVVNM